MPGYRVEAELVENDGTGESRVESRDDDILDAAREAMIEAEADAFNDPDNYNA